MSIWFYFPVRKMIQVRYYLKRWLRLCNIVYKCQVVLFRVKINYVVCQFLLCRILLISDLYVNWFENVITCNRQTLDVYVYDGLAF